MAATKASAARNTRTKKKERKNIAAGTAHIQSTFNNTIVTITDAVSQNFLCKHNVPPLGMKTASAGFLLQRLFIYFSLLYILTHFFVTFKGHSFAFSRIQSHLFATFHPQQKLLHHADDKYVSCCNSFLQR